MLTVTVKSNSAFVVEMDFVVAACLLGAINPTKGDRSDYERYLLWVLNDRLTDCVVQVVQEEFSKAPEPIAADTALEGD